MLVEAMQARGFKNYPMEWWHFTWQPEPYPDTYLRFPHQATSHRRQRVTAKRNPKSGCDRRPGAARPAWLGTVP